MPPVEKAFSAKAERLRGIVITLCLLAQFLSAGAPPAAQGGILINEFMASNKKTLLDEDGASSDWLELYNPDAVAVNLQGWLLTDTTNNLAEWRLPNISMPPNGYLVIFASGKNRTNPLAPLHTNFQLAKDGQYLGLLDARTNVVSDFAPQYPPQQPDISYGRDRTSPGVLGYFTIPTPGGPNSTSGAGFSPDVNFSRKSSTFTESFSLGLSTRSSTATNAVIRYTLDGTIPTANSALYLSPIPISATTQVRARAFQPGYFPGAPHSESFLQLSTNLLSFSSSLPIVVLHSISPAILPDNPKLFTALEVFEPYQGRSSVAGPPPLASRAGISDHGSSTGSLPKHSFNLEIWDEFDTGQNVSLLGLPSNNDFILYAPNKFEPVEIHNPFMYELSNAIGRYASRTRFVEVFVNLGGGALDLTHYNGLYVLEERIKIDPDRVNIDRLTASNTAPPAVTGGYLLSIDRPNAGITLTTPYLPNVPSQTANFLNPDGVTLTLPQWGPQLDYINGYFGEFVNALNSDSFADPAIGYAPYIDVDSWIDYHILNVLSLNPDALRLSTYFYKPRNGRITFGPIWDFDRTLGSTDGRDFNPLEWSPPLNSGIDFFYGFRGTQYWWGRLFQDLEFWQKWIDRWQQLRREAFGINNMNGLIDTFAGAIAEAEARDIARWPGFTSPRVGFVSSSGYSYNFGNGGYAAEVAFMKQWLADRVSFIDNNFVSAPIMNQFGGRISNGFKLTLTAPPGAAVFYTLDSTDPRSPGGAVSPSALAYAGPITLSNNVRILARARDLNHQNLTGGGAGNPWLNSTWSGPVNSLFVVATPPLVITEIMYHPEPPPAGSSYTEEDFEYLELKNIGASPIDLTGIRFTNGISFSFTGSSVTTLAAGAYVLLVRNIAAFASRYGPVSNVAGAYSGSLNNSGDRLALVGPLGEPILDFSYDNGWYPITDGLGFSLVIVDENAPLNTWGLKASWRPSSRENGSPATGDAPPQVVAPVLVNEVLNHPGPLQSAAVELFNPNPIATDVGGWFLSDNFDKPKKYRIADGTIIAAGGYLTFTAAQFDPSPGIGGSFTFNASGDDAYLFSGDAHTNLTGYFHGESFGAAETGVSFGRYQTSEGKTHFVAEDTQSFGATNSLPKVGPVVISEIMYHPRDFIFGTNKVDDTHDEYVRLTNITGASVTLFDSAYPTNSWRVRGGIDYVFPANVTMPAGGEVVLVNFDPSVSALEVSRFRGQFGIAANVPLFGPYGGKLNNAGDNIELAKPGAPEGPTAKDPGFVPYILVDKVEYSNLPPWPTAPDGSGASLRRIDPGAFGNDPVNWRALGVMRALILSQPQSQAVRMTSLADVIVTNITFSVSVLGGSPITYQWSFNGINIPGATNRAYTLNSVSLINEGSYQVIVTDAVGSNPSDPASLRLLVAPAVVQPLPSQPITLLQGSSITYTVAVRGYPPPFNYQWRRGALILTNIPLNSTNCSFTLSNLQPSNSSLYRVVITNIATPANTTPANSFNSLTVLADSDRDGLPDFWEILYGLNPNDPTDAGGDADGDGLTNLGEYLAGTDPTNALSSLRIDRLDLGPGPPSIQFLALSNKTYSLQYKDSFYGGKWSKFADVNARPSNRVETVTDSLSAGNARFYRLAIPSLPVQTNPPPANAPSP